MKKYILIVVLIVIKFVPLNAQMCDSIAYKGKLSQQEYDALGQYNDSVLKVGIKPDTVSVYHIDSIATYENYYMVYAHRQVCETVYYYRIRSDFVDNDPNYTVQIETGKSYQLDVRNYRSHKERLHFIPGGVFNLITEMGSLNFGFNPLDVVTMRDDPVTMYKCNVALNLKGLCVQPSSVPDFTDSK